MFFYIVLTQISTTSGLWSTGNTCKYQHIKVYIYQCVNGQLSLDKLKLNHRSHKNLPNSGFWGWLSAESQPRNLRTIWTNFRSRVLRSLHMKFEFDWPSGFRGEDVWNCGRTDGLTTDAGVTGILLAHPWAFGSGELNTFAMGALKNCLIVMVLLSTHKTCFC